MNVVSLTTIARKRRRCRPRRGSDRLAPRRAQRNAADWRSDLPKLVIKTDAFQQPRGIWVNRDPGSDFPENLGLLEHGYIKTLRPKCERSGQTSNTHRRRLQCELNQAFPSDLFVRFRPGSCANFRCAGKFLNHRLTHRKFLDLAGHRGREALHEPDVARDLVVRDTILTELPDTLLVEGGRRLLK